MRPALGEHDVHAHPGQLTEGMLDVERLALAQGDHLTGRRQPAADLIGHGPGRQHDGSLHKRGMLQVQVTGGGQQHQPRLQTEAECLPQRGELGREVGIDMSGSPQVARGRAQRARADDHRVGAGAQECHQEPVRLVLAADHRAGRDPGADRHHPV